MVSVLLSGGGLDSIAAIEVGGKAMFDIVACVNYGQVSFFLEEQATKNYIHKHNIPVEYTDIDLLKFPLLRWANPNSLLFGTGNEPMIVGRNLWLAFTTALVLYDKTPLHINFALCHEDMMFSDASKQAVDRMNGVFLDAFQGNVTVNAPFGDISKSSFMRLAYNRNSNFMNESFTCWTPANGKECGTCYHCIKKAKLVKEMENGNGQS